MSLNTPLQRAKTPKSAIAGPYGHPLHPMLVTVPIGAWIASIIFDIVGFASDDPDGYVRAAWILIVIGLVGAVLAAIWGFIDFLQLESGTQAKRVATIHMGLNLGVTVLFIINLVVRLAADEDHVSVVGFVLSVIGIVALAISGWLGGRLAYTYGVRVADEDTQIAGFRRTTGAGRR